MPRGTTALAPRTAACLPANSSMPTQTETKPESLFLFLEPVDVPTNQRSAQARKQVRSHVTVQQHRRRKQEELEGKRKPGSNRLGHRPQKHLVRAGVQAGEEEQDDNDHDDDDDDDDNYYDHGANEAQRRQRQAQAQSAAAAAEEQLYIAHRHPYISTSAHLLNPLANPYQNGSLALQLYIIQDPTNAIGSVLCELSMSALQAVEHYSDIVLEAASHYEPQFVPLTQPGSASHYIKDIYEDPALTGATILRALSHLLPPSARTSPPMLRLRGHVIHTINEALDDPVRAMTDHVIGAVFTLAVCEALDGVREFYGEHMRGLMGMINRRGGFRELGFGGGMEAYIRWQDKQAAELFGETYCHLVENQGPRIPEV